MYIDIAPGDIYIDMYILGAIYIYMYIYLYVAASCVDSVVFKSSKYVELQD